MGLLDVFRSRAEPPAPLPSGSFTIDRAGEILSSTVASTFSRQSLKDIGLIVLKIFREAAPFELAFTDVVINFASLTIKARELRGGAIVFLSPRATGRK